MSDIHDCSVNEAIKQYFQRRLFCNCSPKFSYTTHISIRWRLPIAMAISEWMTPGLWRERIAYPFPPCSLRVSGCREFTVIDDATRNDFESDPWMTVVSFYTTPIDLWQDGQGSGGRGQGSGGGLSGRGSSGGQRTRTQDTVRQAGSGERSVHGQADKVPVIDYKDKFWMLDWVGEAGQTGSGLMLYVVFREDIRPIGGIQFWAGRGDQLATFELTMQLNDKGHIVAETNHVVLMWRNHKGYGKSLVDVFNPDPDSRLRLPDLRQVLVFFDTNSVEGHRPVAHKEDTITEPKSVMSSARPTVGAITIRQPLVTTPAVREERQHALISTPVVPRAGQIAAKGPAHAQAPPSTPKKFRSVRVKEPLSVLHDIVRTSSMCAEPMYGAVHRGVQPLYFGYPGEGSSGEENQIRLWLARLNPNVYPSRVDIRTNEVFQELKALRRLEYLEEFYDRQTSPAFGYNWRIDEGDETGGKRGQDPSGGASGEGGEHPSGDEGGGDEGGCDKGGDKGGSGEGGGTSEAPGYSQPTTGTSEGQAHHHHERSASGVGGHIDIRGLPQVKLSTAVEQVDKGYEGGQSVTTTVTAVTVTDNEWCDGSGTSVFPVGEKGNIGSPQGQMWMSMDILPYGLGSQGRLRAPLDETMYLAETEQQLEAHTPLDEETLRGDLEIPAEFQSPISEEKAQRGSQEAGTVTGYQEEAMLAEEMEPGGEPNSPFDEDIPGSDFHTGTGGSQDSPIVFDTAGKNDTLEGLVAKEAIQVPDIEEDERHSVLTTPEQQTPVEEGRESALRTPVQQFSPSVKVINIEDSPFTSRQFEDAKEDGARENRS
ncbi:hypothetical protein CBR_g37450 [Chara braunii]|uniref:Uncharacterized protein n=1 Tax=Chara braunii TaxID=69332 RepID=A0A388LMV1_CHABU|nr:hypothetical protein CBR_g37450 [Chara braunii]|eukprot:GBG83648.1 hypothetical protein CBR_g37450 [Chara braunii]